MKRLIAAFALFAIAIIGPVTRVSAQVQVLHATVPFDFTVGNRLLPLGTYRIMPSRNSGVLIQSKEQGVTAFAMDHPKDRSADRQTKLVFAKVGGRYFLKEIVSTSEIMVFPTPKLEKGAKVLRGSLDSD